MSKLDSVATLKDALRQHFSRVVLPIWQGPGFNKDMRLPYEAVSASTHTVAPVSRYRAMACARQLFVFSQAGATQHAHMLFESLIHHFRNPNNDGWFYSIDAAGRPLDTTSDLYTHAFIIFACAEYAARFANSDAIRVLHRTSSIIEDKFGAQSGMFNAALDEHFGEVVGTPIQNPLMHLTEAWLAAYETTEDTAFSDALLRLGNTISDSFVQKNTGCIAELPIGMSNNRIEPGHQFEWFWLANRAGRIFENTGLIENLTRAFMFAQSHGVDQASGGVSAALDETGATIDATQRIWAQSEYLRALAIRDDDVSAVILLEQMKKFETRFLHSTGWFESMTPTAKIIREDMPSTTPYHLATAYAAL
ncbi:AGE family epimerase/isomerase [Paraburkholderia sp. D1E]|uniref:AGE family epimerase/isomerase n=1 Tax=Paraburkholderia sp. D1E TaxID=3461398 RepID=UPI004045BD85